MAIPPSSIINFILPLPPSVNCLYDGGKKTKQRFKSDAYKKWAAMARQFTQAFRADYESMNGGWWEIICHPVAVMYRYGDIPDKRQRDLENYVKAISDLLVDENFLKDDSQIKKTYLEWVDDIEPKYVEVVIMPVARMVVNIEE